MIRSKGIKGNPIKKIFALAEVLKQDKRINALYLFGSYAKGRIKPLSDIDIAVLLRKDVPGFQYWDYKINLLSKAAVILKTEEIDLVLLNEAPFELRYNILKEGKILFCRDKIGRQEFQEGAVLDYLDTRHLRGEGFFHIKERLRTGRFADEEGRHKKDFESVRRLFGEIAAAG